MNKHTTCDHHESSKRKGVLGFEQAQLNTLVVKLGERKSELFLHSRDCTCLCSYLLMKSRKDTFPH
jgi:hypothetical protein